MCYFVVSFVFFIFIFFSTTLSRIIYHIFNSSSQIGKDENRVTSRLKPSGSIGEHFCKKYKFYGWLSRPVARCKVIAVEDIANPFWKHFFPIERRTVEISSFNYFAEDFSRVIFLPFRLYCTLVRTPKNDAFRHKAIVAPTEVTYALNLRHIQFASRRHTFHGPKKLKAFERKIVLEKFFVFFSHQF